MSQMARAGSMSAPIRSAALYLTRDVHRLHQKDFEGEIVALNTFVRDNIRYVRDVKDVETLQIPRVTLQFGCGDCDDKSTLLASLLLSIGFPAWFVALNRNGVWAHVWTATQLHGKFINLETTEPVLTGQTATLVPSDKLMIWEVKP